MGTGWLCRQVLMAEEGTTEQLISVWPQEESDVLEQEMWVTPRRWGATSRKAVTQNQIERSW